MPKLPESSAKTKTWFRISRWAYLLFHILVMFLLTFYAATIYGEWDGKVYVLQRAPLIRLTSEVALNLGPGMRISDPLSGRPYYEYNGLHMLTFNEDTYYLFRDIDATTCRPIEVYAVQKVPALQISLMPPASLAGVCQMKHIP